jgi:DNA-binding MarR family transcriptional regulator
MAGAAAAKRLMDLYPRIFFACHKRHVRDPETRNVLSAHQASILDHLDELEPTSLTGLADHMGVTLSTMSLGVERLVRRGYVLRSRDPKDARRIHLRLSARGARLRDAQSVLDPERVRKLLECLAPEELESGLRGLALLAAAADESMRRLSRQKRRKEAV